MFTIYGKRYHSYNPIIDTKTGEVLDDGQPKRVKLGGWEEEKLAKRMAENIKNSVPKRTWNIWVEQV